MNDIELQLLDAHTNYSDLRNTLALEELTPEKRAALEIAKCEAWNKLLELQEQANQERTLVDWGWAESWM